MIILYDCEQDTDTVGASIDESTISTYDISRAVQLKKTRSLTDIEKLKLFKPSLYPTLQLQISN